MKVSCLSVSCVLCNSCRSYLFRFAGSMVVRPWGRNQEGRFVSELRSSELSALVRRVCSSKSCSYYQMDEFRQLRRSKRLGVRRGWSRKADQRVSGSYMNQSLSQPPKPIRLTPHETLERAKFQAASSGVVRLTSPLELAHENVVPWKYHVDSYFSLLTVLAPYMLEFPQEGV